MSQQAASAATFSTLVTSTSVAAHAWAAGTAVSSCTPNAVLLAGKGDLLPVSALPPDGTFPTNTARIEKRSIASNPRHRTVKLLNQLN